MDREGTRASVIAERSGLTRQVIAAIEGGWKHELGAERWNDLKASLGKLIS